MGHRAYVALACCLEDILIAFAGITTKHLSCQIQIDSLGSRNDVIDRKTSIVDTVFASHEAITDERPIDETCTCPTCARFSRAYLHHLDRCGEMLAPMLASVHNLHYYVDLMRQVREALEQGRFAAFAAAFRADRARGV